MRSGRHGAARPPIGVLIQQDRVDFSLFALIIVVSLVFMVMTGPGSLVFWLAFIPILATAVLIARRIETLSRAELRDAELL